ncbi:MAG: pyridoxal phosphate-dependent aminotransferase [Firmicutes bacterium]|nr:pyridoxal phosphate-dependent aminotransferase [Bacillota bacterium]
MPSRAHSMSLLGTETAFEVLAEVQRLEAQGREIVSFAIGEPDFDTPENIKEAGIEAIRTNYTHYSPSAGIMPLREAIANYVSQTRHIRVDPEQVVVTPGGKPIMFHSILATVNPGDEVVYPNPGYPIYESVIRFVGATPVPLSLREERGFSFDVDELRAKVGPKTSMIILNSPHNPTGGILKPSDLEAVAELALRYDCWVLSDEIYSRIVFDGDVYSISSIPDMEHRTIILDGFSKTYSMTGWRLGYGVMPKSLATDVTRLVTNVESCTATFVQMAGIEALTGPQDAVDRMVAEFKARRDLIVEGLNSIEGITCLLPGGAFYVFPNVTGACRRLGLRSSRELQQRLLYEGNVAVLPRSSFGMRNEGETQEYIRLSYATSRQQIEEGLRRIRSVVEG